MKQRLVLKPLKYQDGVKYKIIQITDITLHTGPKRPTESIAKKVGQAMDNNTPGRVYAPLQKTDNPDISLDIAKDPEFIKMLQAEEEKGYKVLISLPKGGIPIFAGKDTEEFINSKNGQRIIRKLAKNKKQ